MNVISNKNDNKKFKKIINKKIGNKIKRAKFKKKFNSNENGIKNVTDLLNLIYDNNINREQKIKSNRTIHEILFDVRDAVELKNPNDERYLENKNDYDKFNKKINATKEILLNPKNNNENYSQIKSLNYDNDINENEIIFNENNNLDLSNNIYYNFNNNNNETFKIYENTEQPEDTDEVKPSTYNGLKKGEFLENNYSEPENIINNIDVNNLEDSSRNNNNNNFINEVKAPEKIIINKANAFNYYDNQNIDNNPKTYNYNVQNKEIINNNTKPFNYNNLNNKNYNNIETFNYDNENKYSYINNKLELPINENNTNMEKIIYNNRLELPIKQKNINTGKIIYNNNNKKNGFVIYNNFRPSQNKQIHNIKLFNLENNAKENKNMINNDTSKNNYNNIITEQANQTFQKEENLMEKNRNSLTKEDKNHKDNNYIYNKKNINKKIRTYSYDIQNNNLNDFYKDENSRKNKKIILEKESKISLNITASKTKPIKNSNINNKNSRQICKNEEIFIERSPNKKAISSSKSNSCNKAKTKQLYKDFKINKNFFTIINEVKSNEKEIIKENKNKIGYKDIYLKTEMNKKKNKLKKNNFKKVTNKSKNNTNIKTKKHSKNPKKQPVVNINIDLKDLIKQDNIEKFLDNNKKKESKPKKTKEYFDYPEDLKYNVFGKQYKFSYKD